MTVPRKSSSGRVRLNSNLSCSQDNQENSIHFAFPTFIKRPVREEPVVNGKGRRPTGTPCTSDKWLEFVSGRREIKFQGMSMFKKMWKKCLHVKINILSQNQARQKSLLWVASNEIIQRRCLRENGWKWMGWLVSSPCTISTSHFFSNSACVNASIWNILEEFKYSPL